MSAQARRGGGVGQGRRACASPRLVAAPNQFDRDYKAGVDALRIDVPFGSFSGVNLIGALGREITAAGTYVGGGETWHTSWFGSAVLARVFTHVHGWDLSAQAGKIYGGYQIGGGRAPGPPRRWRGLRKHAPAAATATIKKIVVCATSFMLNNFGHRSCQLMSKSEYSALSPGFLA